MDFLLSLLSDGIFDKFFLQHKCSSRYVDCMLLMISGHLRYPIPPLEHGKIQISGPNIPTILNGRGGCFIQFCYNVEYQGIVLTS